MRKILVTGSQGLVGKRLCQTLRDAGVEVVEIDLNGVGENHGDVRDTALVKARLDAVEGVVHLAAVSRVVWGERDPELCRSVNIDGTKGLIAAAFKQKKKPWILFSSSREVYGESSNIINEEASFAPCGVYAETKVECERLLAEAKKGGLVTGVVRLSNVYGNIDDHEDRVIPAFLRAALLGKPLQVEGSGNAYDFTYLDDTVDGIYRYIKYLDAGKMPGPIQLLTGVSTTLGELARMVVKLTTSDSVIQEAPPRDYGSGKFIGINTKAKRELDWTPQTELSLGLTLLAKAYRQHGLRDDKKQDVV